MRKLLLTLVAALLIGTASASDLPVDYNSFPKAAKEFITKHFPKIQVASATLDDDGEYTAYLNTGAKVEFRNNGEWKEVNCRGTAVPTGIIPAKIASYVKTNYSTANIVKIDKDYNDYEIKLSTGIELKFDLQGNFLRMDD